MPDGVRALGGDPIADTSVVGRGVLGPIYVYSHFPLLAGVAALGVGIKLAITQVANPALTAGTRWALAGHWSPSAVRPRFSTMRRQPPP